MIRKLIKEHKLIYETVLCNAFPNEDIDQIEKDFKDEFIEVEWLIGDFDEFCSLIAGSSTYVLAKKKVPNFQKQPLYMDFFSRNPQYLFLKDYLSHYPDFNKELESFEKVRSLLVNIIEETYTY